MTGVTVIAGDVAWRFLPEPEPAAAARYQVVARAQLIDELTGAPPRVPVAATTAEPGLVARASAGGLVGVAGRPQALYPDPWPAVAPRVGIELTAPGFMPLALAGDLPAQAGFPGEFQPLDFGTVALRRQPTRIAGRAVDAAGAPVAGATVAVTAVWRSQVAILGPGDPADGLSVAVGLYADRPAGATMRRRTLTLLAAPKVLVETADAGATRLRISDRQALLLGRPLAIDPSDPERTEFIAVTGIDASSSADQPAEVELAHPLARPHLAGVEVARTSFAVPGPANALSVEARRGDVTVLAGLVGFAPGQLTLEISGGAAADEFQGLALWRTTTGPDGGYRLPPIHRLAHLELTASGGGQPQPCRRIVSLAGEPEMIADLVFP